MLYLLKTSLSLAAFYLFYKLLCSRDTWHRQNRLLLLVILALSAVIPFLYIDLGSVASEASVIIEELSGTFVADAAELEAEAATAPRPTWWQQIPWCTLLTAIYLVGLVVCFAHFLMSLLAIGQLILKSKRSSMADGTVLVTHTKSYGPFSWMRYIIVSERDLSDNFDMILAHERAHIRLHHSWDLLFAQLFAIAQWFNPAAWLLKRELEAIHEYEADSDTLRQGFDAHQYQLRLFEAVIGTKFNTVTNNFNNCSTKKRIIMMMKRQSSPWTRMKALFVLPVAFAAVSIFSCTSPKEKKAEANQESAAIIETNGKGDPLLVLVLPDGTEMYKIGEGNWVDEYNKDSKSYLAQFNLTEMDIEAIKVLKEDEAQAAYGKRAANGAIKFYLKGTTDKEIIDAMWQHAKSTGNDEVMFQLIKRPTDAAKSENTELGDIQVVSYASQPKAKEQGEIFQVVEEQPMFPGGMEEMMKFLQQNTKYPKEAQDKGIQGRVIVQFVVNKDGSISNDTVVRSVDPMLDAEAVRVVRSMPNWTPGKQKGEPVRVRFTLPVSFRLHDATPANKEAKPAVTTETATAGEEIFKVVEEMPQYPGGMEELMKYLQKNIRYPKEAQNKGIQGRVVVQFVVNKDGSITDSKVVKAVDPQLDAEALRVVNAMPNWTPGKQKGEPVRTHFTIPVSFRLAN